MTTEEYKAAATYWAQKQRREMPADELKKLTEEYLITSSVCALATGTGDYVRCTPLEYSFHDGKFWIFTEGGEKFIGLEKNKNVSLAVFDANPGFGSLKSVQVMGVADLIKPMSEAYISHAEYKKIPVKALQNLADQGKPMHLLCIKPVRMDVLCSDFKKDGYDSRQVLICQSE
jgi:hypothetical protein